MYPPVSPNQCCISKIKNREKFLQIDLINPWVINTQQEAFYEKGTSDLLSRNGTLIKKAGTYLYLTADKEYSSVSMASSPPNATFWSNIPQSANSYSYCIMIKPSTIIHGGFANWNLFMVLQGSTSAGVTCMENGTMKIEYQNQTFDSSTIGRKNIVKTLMFNLSENFSRIDTFRFGMVDAIYVTITNATRESSMKWIEYYPLGYTVFPDFTNAWHFIAVLCLALTFGLASYTLYFFSSKYYQKRNPMHLYHALSEGLLIVWLIVHSIYFYWQQYDLYLQNVLQALDNALFAFSTFCSCLHVIVMLVGVLGQTVMVNTIIYVSFVIFHIIFAGWGYISYLTFMSSVSDDWKKFLNGWLTITPVWTVYSLLLVLAPTAFLIYKVVIKSNTNNRDNEQENGGPWTRLKRLFQYDMLISSIILTYFTTISIYIILKFLDLLALSVFGDKGIMYSFQVIRSLFLFIPYVLNSILLDHLPGIFY